MDFKIREMTLQDYDSVIHLWKQSEGIGLSTSDEPASLLHFLERNPHLSFVAFEDETIIGAVMCGHDGRRGFMYHLAVDLNYRRKGIATQLIQRCLKGLEELKIDKCHVMVYTDNETGLHFWRNIGWADRPELVLLSRMI